MNPQEIIDKIPNGNWTIKEIMELAACSQADAIHAMSMYFGPRVREGQIGPKWEPDKGAHVYPFWRRL